MFSCSYKINFFLSPFYLFSKDYKNCDFLLLFYVKTARLFTMKKNLMIEELTEENMGKAFSIRIC